MNRNKIFNVLLSFPVILITLYFIPFLGVCLLITRFFIKKDVNKISKLLVIVGFIILIPNIINYSLQLFKIDFNLKDYLNNEFYLNIIKYGKRLITCGIIFFIISYITDLIQNKVINKFKSIIEQEENKSYQIDKQNDLVMKEKRYKAENSHVIYCPYCGGDNIINGNVGVCKYCRRKISKNKKVNIN